MLILTILTRSLFELALAGALFFDYPTLILRGFTSVFPCFYPRFRFPN